MQLRSWNWAWNSESIHIQMSRTSKPHTMMTKNVFINNSPQSPCQSVLNCWTIKRIIDTVWNLRHKKIHNWNSFWFILIYSTTINNIFTDLKTNKYFEKWKAVETQFSEQIYWIKLKPFEAIECVWKSSRIISFMSTSWILF